MKAYLFVFLMTSLTNFDLQRSQIKDFFFSGKVMKDADVGYTTFRIPYLIVSYFCLANYYCTSLASSHLYNAIKAFSGPCTTCFLCMIYYVVEHNLQKESFVPKIDIIDTLLLIIVAVL